ncbi:vacuolar protein sorting-associated protein 72 homolog [Babylonia areolata]|uniref:vacuolar protein sorting-associated protein 72 homolog n=1 Tax=Babylonia areolata TaxID=304850 RepID=UPI003FCF349D
MAAERSRRGNAGSRMTQMLEAEDEDEFYKTTYGGFEEEAEDNDYNSEESDSESTDSDFSIDENDEVRSDVDDDDEPKRKKRVVTKAYKEPKREEPDEKKVKVEEIKKEKKKKTADIPSVQIYMSPERKSLRKSTAVKSKQTQSRQKQREEQAKMLAEIADRNNVKVEDVRRLTQEELLAEAKVTEQINMKSLENYQKLELEKKRARVQKEVYRGPVIRYHSVTMPLLNDDACLDPEINVDGDGDAPMETVQPLSTTGERCSRTFVTFTDQNVFHSVFPQVRRKAPQKSLCPVTRLPAKYVDPLTDTPYATLQAFRLIREAYTKQLAQPAAGEGGKSSSGSLLTVAQQRRGRDKDKAQLSEAAQ